MNHSYQRYTGAGNTFVVMNTYEDPLSIGREAMKLLVEKACSYNEGIGADGVILVNQSSVAPFRMDFYNPDGSTGMLCGNGARCAVQAAKEYGFIPDDTTEFEVLGAINKAEFLKGGNVRVHFQDPSVVKLDFQLRIARNEFIRANYVDVGSQHVVVFFDDLRSFGEEDIERMNIKYFGPMLRWHPDLAPVGANANFIEVRQDGEEKYLRIRTFERGVEGETLACGTGCMSSAIVAHRLGAVTSLPVRLLTQSGEYVAVNFTVQGDRITNLSLEGSAVRGEEGAFTFDETNGAFAVTYP